MDTVLGLLFTFLWSSAAIATKLGLHSITPLALATFRLLTAGVILWVFVYRPGTKYPRPRRADWGPLVILGLLNTTLYLGATFWALDVVPAGLFNLFVTTNPFLVACLSSIWLKRKISRKEWLGMLVAATGLGLAIFPTLEAGGGSISGIVILGLGMSAMAVGSVYFKKADLQLPSIVINTWQLLIGGVLSIPITYMLEKDKFFIRPDLYLAGALFWLVLVISIGTMLLWFYLLRQDAVRANNWLFMTPVFGYLLAAVFLHEAITVFDIAATGFVIAGLLLSGNIPVHSLRRILFKRQ
jgi:drug/metabolite transporter (DMT)-like permease